MSLPEASIGVQREGADIVPRWLTPRLRPAVDALIDAYASAVGQPRRVLRERVRRARADRADPVSRRLLCRVLDDLYPAQAPRRPMPRAVRLSLWHAAARCATRGQALSAAAALHGVSEQTVEHLLFADLPDERQVSAPERRPEAQQVIDSANRRLLQSLLCRSEYLVLRFRGATRSLMQAIRRSRLIAELRSVNLLDTEVTLSGPLSLHRRTTLYGRRLAGLVPALTRCESWSVLASGRLHGEPFRLRCSHLDPVAAPPGPTARFDSRLEDRFHQDFQRCAPQWELHREPRPLACGDGWIFPDFQAHPVGCPERAAVIEIVGFWTPKYLRHKLERLRRAALGRALILVDETLAVGPDDLPDAAHLLRYRRRINAPAVLAALEDLCG